MHENIWGKVIFSANLMFRLYKFDGSIFGGHIFGREVYIWGGGAYKWAFTVFKHSFQDTIYPLWIHRKEVEITSHVLLSCPNYFGKRSNLVIEIRIIVPVNVGPCSLLSRKPKMNSLANIEQKEPRMFGDIVPG